jgi:hypothetical protein
VIDYSYIPSGLDARTDLGRGTIKSKFHQPRSKGSTFPYVEPDPEIDEIEAIDDASLDAIASKSLNHRRVDPYSSRTADKFYVSTIKLSDCFDRTDDVLAEIHALGDTMSPIPVSRKKRTVGLPGASAKYSTGSKHYRSPGSKQGWFSPPPKKWSDPNNDEFDQPVFDLQDLADKILRIVGR